MAWSSRARAARSITAPNGKEALVLLQDGLRPSIVLLDLMMPVMSGWKLREQMLRDPGDGDHPHDL